MRTNPIYLLYGCLLGAQVPLPKDLDPLWADICYTLNTVPPEEREAAFMRILRALPTPDLHHLHALTLKEWLAFSDILLTPHHFDILNLLALHGPRPLNAIAAALKQDPSNTHTRLLSLTKKDLLTRFYKDDRIHYRCSLGNREMEQKNI